MATLEELAAKGANKLGAKVTSMQASFRASRDRAIAGYDATPFGPTRKQNYRSAWTYMPDNYNLKVQPGIENKWRDRWIAKMRE